MKIKWDEVGKRLYETGVDHGVLFPMGEDNAYGKGVPWYGLSAVNESPSGGEPTRRKNIPDETSSSLQRDHIRRKPSSGNSGSERRPSAKRQSQPEQKGH